MQELSINWLKLSVEQLNPNISIFVIEGKEKRKIVTFLKLGADMFGCFKPEKCLTQLTEVPKFMHICFLLTHPIHLFIISAPNETNCLQALHDLSFRTTAQQDILGLESHYVWIQRREWTYIIIYSHNKQIRILVV